MGGGSCGQITLQGTLDLCYQRSAQFYGSSKLWSDNLSEYLARGYLSIDPYENAFANWTKVFIPSCDGALHQGNTKNPVRYRDRQLYFRGSVITRSHLKWIDSKYNLKGARKVVLTGLADGAIAVNSWSNYVKSLVGDASKVYSIADSGMYLDFPSIKGDNLIEKRLNNIYTLANADESTPLEECNKHNAGAEWKCLLIENAYPYIQGRFMVLGSQYDTYAIQEILRIDCLKTGTAWWTLEGCSDSELAYIEKYRSSYRDVLSKFRAINVDLSVWSISCVNDGYAFFKLFYDNPNQKVPAKTGHTMRDIVEAFVLFDQKNVAIDEAGWPSNVGCAL